MSIPALFLLNYTWLLLTLLLNSFNKVTIFLRVLYSYNIYISYKPCNMININSLQYKDLIWPIIVCTKLVLKFINPGKQWAYVNLDKESSEKKWEYVWFCCYVFLYKYIVIYKLPLIIQRARRLYFCQERCPCYRIS